MNRDFIKQELLTWVLLLAPTIYLAVIWNQLPARVPIHWNAQGEIDGYGSPATLLVVFFIDFAVYLLLLFLPRIDPKKENYNLFSTSFTKMRLITVLFMGVVHMVLILSVQGIEMNVPKIITISILLLFVTFGNYFSTIRPNYFVGIRTPWTIENETVWKKTHQIAGKLWFWGGLAGILLLFMLRTDQIFPVFMVITLIIGLIPVVYSYLFYKKITKVNGSV